MRLWRQFCLMLLIFGGALLFAPQPASAFELAPAFTCSGGTASGTFLTTQDCAGEFDEERMFSYFVCQYEQILNELLSEVYCAILDQSIPAISAALTLLISLAAASFLMGVSPFNAKELMVLAAKFTLVFAFAMQADYMIGIGYQLFMTGSKEGIVYVLQYLFESGYTYETGEGSSVTVTISTISDVYHIFDQFITNIITDSTKGQMDDGSECKNALLMLIFVVSAAVPPLAIIAIYFVVRVVWMILRAIFGYCQGILGVTFLVTLAPIYVSFALFRATRPMFDKWVQYLISFSFQMVIVFGFLGFMFNSFDKMGESLSDYTKLVKPLKAEQARRPSIFNAVDTCGICEIQHNGADKAPTCKSDKVMPLTSLVRDEEVLKVASYKIVALVILFMIFDMLLSFVPSMAAYLAGSKHAATLGGGSLAPGSHFQDNVAMPGSQAVASTFQSAGQEFIRSGSTPEGIVNGFVGAIKGSDGKGGLMGSGGVVDHMIRSIGNPGDPFRLEREGSTSDAASGFFDAAFAVTGAGAAAGHFLGKGGGGGHGATGSGTRHASGGGGGGGHGGGGTGGPSYDEMVDQEAANAQARQEARQQLANMSRLSEGSKNQIMRQWSDKSVTQVQQLAAQLHNALGAANSREELSGMIQGLDLSDDAERDIMDDYFPR